MALSGSLCLSMEMLRWRRFVSRVSWWMMMLFVDTALVGAFVIHLATILTQVNRIVCQTAGITTIAQCFDTTHAQEAMTKNAKPVQMSDSQCGRVVVLFKRTTAFASTLSGLSKLAFYKSSSSILPVCSGVKKVKTRKDSLAQ
jgi:hypothetical protein